MPKKRDDLLANAYAVLGLSPDASMEEAKVAYDASLRRAAKDDHGWDRIKEIGRAFEILVEHSSSTMKTTRPKGQTVLLPATACPRGCLHRVVALLFPPAAPVSRLSYWSRVCFFLFILAWGVRFILAPIANDYVMRSFMHLVDLPLPRLATWSLLFWAISCMFWAGPWAR